MDLDIRRYNESDYLDVNRIIKESFGYDKSKKKNDSSYEFVAVLDNKIVGYYVLCEIIDVVKDIKIFHIDYVCVSNDYRGLGIGKRMMEYIEEYAKGVGCSRLELTSSSKREIAHKLYLGMGYVIRESSIFRKELV